MAFPFRCVRHISARALLVAALVPALSPILHAEVGPGDLLLEAMVSGLAQPVDIAQPRDGSRRLFLAEKTGKIKIFDGAQLLPTPFLDLGSKITTDGERGLLGLVFHPRFEINGFFYLNYTDLNGDTIIARYTVSADPNLADPGSETVLLTVPQPFSNHNGGQVAFGPDGFLYVALGDGGSGGDPLNNGQNLGTLLGKLLRIDVDAGAPFAIPPTNPFVGRPGAREEIWAYGLRNPWRFSFDRLTGDLLIADVGQAEREEVDFQAAASPGGENYGWRLMEGSLCFNPPTNCNDGTLTLPVLEYDHSNGDCSITGGFRYRGSRFPQLQGTYLYADFCTGRIWGATPDSSGAWSSTLLLDTDFLITTFGEDEEGELYLADFAGGTIYRVLVRDFSLAVQPSSVTVQAGQSATYSLTVTPLGASFDREIVFTCSGLPALTSCTFSPPRLTPGGSSTTTTLIVSTTAAATLGPQPWSRPDMTWPPVWLLLVAWTVATIAAAARWRFVQPAAITLVVLLLALQVGCGGGGNRPLPRPGTPPGTYSITISGQSGSLVRQATIVLVVQ